LSLANFSACQEVLRRVEKTFQAFFARVKRKEKAGFPRFKPQSVSEKSRLALVHLKDANPKLSK
jgi:hypothetical protein